ncbi:MAG TPA: hypothetical protein VKU83_06485 [Puia sp.]|nr:hypothetical protein [Puia sp.]
MGKHNLPASGKFGRLTILEEAIPRGIRRERYVSAICECGKIGEYRLQNLKNGNTTSCGCFHRKADGIWDHKIYKVLSSMKGRCYNPKSVGYKYYGARGIVVCDEWLKDKKAFFRWAIANGWAEHLEIDRIDVDGNYEPLNCRFVLPKANMRNRRTTTFIVFNGQKRALTEWAELYNLPQQVVRKRFQSGWDLQKLFSTPVIDNKSSLLRI